VLHYDLYGIYYTQKNQVNHYCDNYFLVTRVIYVKFCWVLRKTINCDGREKVWW